MDPCECQHPEKLKGILEKCTPEQIQECHGKPEEHPCTCQFDEGKDQCPSKSLPHNKIDCRIFRRNTCSTAGGGDVIPIRPVTR